MTLKKKVAVIILGVFLVLGAVNWTVLHFVMLPGFLSLEKEEAIKDVNRVEQAIHREIEYLESLIVDWAAWDDTYDFVASHSADYIEANLPIETFQNNRLNLIYILNGDREVVWGRIVEPETEEEFSIENFPGDRFPEVHPLLVDKIKETPFSEMSVSGVHITREGPMIVSSHPILTSSNTGPVRGTMIMGYFMTDDRIRNIADQTQVDIDIIPIEGETQPENVAGLSDLIAGKTKYLMNRIREESVLRIATVFPDVEGKAALIVRAEIPRKIMAKGYSIALFSAVSFLTTIVTAIVIIMLLMQRVVLKPIAKLTAQVIATKKSRGHPIVSSAGCRDEIGVLGREFEDMMNQLGKRSVRLEELNKELLEDIQKRQEIEAALRLNEARLETQLKLSQMTKEPLKKIFDFALEEAVALTGSEIGFLAFVNNEEKVISIYSWSEKAFEECAIPEKEVEYSVEKTGLWGETIRRRRPVVINDYAAENPLKRGCPAGHVTIDRYMSVPVFDGDRIAAMAGVGNKRDEYNNSDVRQLSLLMQGMWLFVKRQQAEEALRASEEKLARSKKMESLGLLAGGVAHDLNNVLSGIVSYPEVLLMDLPDDSKLRIPLETMMTSGNRAVAIVQDLLTVARGVATEKQPVNLNGIVEKYLASAEHQKLLGYNPGISVTSRLDSQLMNIKGSSIHIGKSLMNLVNNAAEAIGNDGSIVISTENRYLDRPLKSYEDVTVGEYAVLTVADNGPGISPADLDRIFEPFYTKKVMGRSGTGLGLTIVWNMVQEHKGYIGVTTDGNGTAFELYFPITRERLLKKDASLPADMYKGNGEKVLVVDDMDSQREIFCKMLEILGYKATSVSSGEKAAEFLEKHTVDLVILDMIMDPGISGCETYERIIRIHPGQKALIVSGFAETDDVRKAQQLGAGQYLKKPVQFRKLGLAVKKALAH